MKKFTNLDEELLKENAQVADKFNANFTSALQKIDDIKIALDDFAIKQQLEPRNWGYVGSLGYVNEQLDNILAFLLNKEE